MKRDPAALERGAFDVLVVGGGIHGACIAREAARRGLATALVEREDFGHATSWNSMRILHGGLRYLQGLDLARSWESIGAQAAWLRLAPGLVRTERFVVPTYAGSPRGRLAMRAGLRLDAWLRRAAGATSIPPGRIVGREECRDLAPHVASEGLTGGALWHEAVAEGAERLLLAVVRSAAAAGAVVANYVEALDARDGRGGPTEVTMRDALTGSVFETRARGIVDARGPGFGRSLRADARFAPIRWARAVNLVTRPLNPAAAVGASAERGTGRLWFVVPWRGVSLAGTGYFPAEVGDDPCPRDDEVDTLVREIGAAFPGSGLRPSDVRLVHGGLVPVLGWRGEDDAVLPSRPWIEERDGIVRVVGIKYTTAPDVAAAVVDGIVARAGRRAPRPPAAPLLDAADRLEDGGSGVAPATLRRLAREHGEAGSRIVALAARDRRAGEPLAEGCDVIGAEVLHAVREEMAVRLPDVVFRRTPLGGSGSPGAAAVEAAATLAARELGWSAARTAEEIAAVRAFLAEHRAGTRGGRGSRSAALP